MFDDNSNRSHTIRQLISSHLILERLCKRMGDSAQAEKHRLIAEDFKQQLPKALAPSAHLEHS